MTQPAALPAGAVAAVYLLWLLSWLVLGQEAFGPAHYNWAQTLAAVAAALAAFAASWACRRPYRGFLVMIGIGLVFLAGSWVTYSPDDPHPLFGAAAAGAPDASDLAYAAFVFVWVCAWGYLALEQWHRRPPSGLTGAVFALLVVGLAVILASFYYPQYRALLDTVSGRLDAAVSLLEFTALVIGLACILLGEPPAVTWLLCGTALLVASDMAYSENQVPVGIEPLWMLAQCLLLATLLVFPRAIGAATAAADAAPRPRSGLSGVLVLLSLGGVLLAVAIGLVPVHPVWKSFLAVLFVVLLAVALVWLTDRFDDAVRFLEAHTARLHRQQLRADDWRRLDARLRATLESTGLGTYLDSLRDSADRLRQDVLFLGAERLYPPPHPPDGRAAPRCFLVMPFGLEWSNDVHQVLSAACTAQAVQPVRGDDVFTPTDILVDIWHGISGADFVIADITGRNPNVLYELGIAHTLAKPVLIVSRSAADIPIDLATRRVILYGQSDGDWRDDLRSKVTKAITEIRRAYGVT